MNKAFHTRHDCVKKQWKGTPNVQHKPNTRIYNNIMPHPKYRPFTNSIPALTLKHLSQFYISNIEISSRAMVYDNISN